MAPAKVKSQNLDCQKDQYGCHLIDLLSLHLLDLVFADTPPHDVSDRSGDETEMDVNLNPAMEAKDVSVFDLKGVLSIL